MEISEVTITLVEDPEDRVKGYCSIIVNDALVVRGIKIIEGRGGYFVAMPSRKMSDNCKKCDRKNHVRARYCNYCGTHLLEDRREKGRKERTNLYADIVHPINAACRQTIQERVIEAFHNELELSAQADCQSANLPIWMTSQRHNRLLHR